MDSLALDEQPLPLAPHVATGPLFLLCAAGWGKEVQVNNSDLMFTQGQWQGQISLVIDYEAIFSGKSAAAGEKKM